jgi:hypothetical protein
MYLNTTYKAFVAHTAAKLMTEMVGQAMANGKIRPDASYNDNKQMFEHLAVQANSAAYALADHMASWWSAEDHETVFFDVQDSTTSRIEAGLNDISEQLKELADKL